VQWSAGRFDHISGGAHTVAEAASTTFKTQLPQLVRVYYLADMRGK